jgi:hypothetical protein
MAADPGDQSFTPNMQQYNQTAEFFLSTYRLGKTLGIGSFGKVRGCAWTASAHRLARKPACVALSLTKRNAAGQGCRAHTNQSQGRNQNSEPP